MNSENAKATAALLLGGSRQINVWREEIDTVVKILASFLRESPPDSPYKIECGDGGTCWWWINAAGPGRPVSIHFIIMWDGERYIYNSHGDLIPSGNQVQNIRAKLDSLVEGLLTRFPWLTVRCKFLLDAAQVAESAK